MKRPWPAGSAPRLAMVWGVVLALCVLLLVNLLSGEDRFDTRITALLPKSQASPLVTQATQQLSARIENRFIVLLNAPSRSGELADALIRQLQASRTTTAINDVSALATGDSLSDYRYRLLSPTLADTDGAVWQQRALRRLFSPGPRVDPVGDPFGLLDGWNRQRLSGPIELVNGQPSVRADDGERWFLVTGKLNGSPFDMDRQAAFMQALDRFQQAHPGAKMLKAGLVFHAASGAAQAKREISTIGIGALLGIIVLVWLTFRRLSTLLTLLTPVGCGIVFALPLTWLLFGQLNLLTLAFGASLVGVSVDYALHLQCMRALNPTQPLSKLWPGLALGLVSSLIAYLVQLATPIPGLRQMATFAALGLIGAWLTVRLWLPLITLHPHPQTRRLASGLDRLRVPLGLNAWWVALAGLGTMAAWLTISQLAVNDDLRQLNPSPATLIQEQQRVQSLLDQADGGSYLIVTAPDEAGMLEQLESLDTPLDQLQREGHLKQYHHLGQAVPTSARQDQNLKRVRRAYHQQLPTVFERAGLPDTLLGEAMAKIDSPVPMLTLSAWLASPAGANDRYLWLGSSSAWPGVATMVSLSGTDATAVKTLSDLAQRPTIDYVDRIRSLSRHLGHVRDTITIWLGVAIVLLTLIFGWRYRRDAWRVLLPPMGALLATLATLSLMGSGLTLFHLLGLMLVLGIGLDAGIFSAEHRESPASWLAITLSCASSLLAFGLLAFSATPALRYLGETCLIGLTATWMLVPFARAASAIHAPSDNRDPPATSGEKN